MRSYQIEGPKSLDCLARPDVTDKSNVFGMILDGRNRGFVPDFASAPLCRHFYK
jgi:hypothetical protein